MQISQVAYAYVIQIEFRNISAENAVSEIVIAVSYA